MGLKVSVDRNSFKAVILVMVLALMFSGFVFPDIKKFKVVKGNIYFKSEAPLELIEANSEELNGLIDFQQKTFAFTVANSSFEGFNSALQREHFNENYMESNKFPRTSFSGKIIEDIDINKNGLYKVRAKGKLHVHGVEKERIIEAIIEVKDNQVLLNSSFLVQLADHQITIPKIVYQKIAEEIQVNIQATLTQN